MTRINALSDADLHDLRRTVQAEYDGFKARGLKLDMTRGSPPPTSSIWPRPC